MEAQPRRHVHGSLLPDIGQVLVLALLVGTPAFLFLALRIVPRLDVVFQSLVFHLVVVSAIAGCALLVAALAASVAARARQYTLIMLTLGCLFVGFFMVGHGLTTPGTWGRPLNWWVARFPTLALAAFAGCLGLALLPPEGRFPRFLERHALAALIVPTVGTTLACAAVVMWPTAWIGSRLLPGEEVATKTLAAISALSLFLTGEIHRRRWALSQDRFELALLLACWLSTESIVSLQLGRLWYLSWWDYHALLLVGFGASVYAVLTGYRRNRTVQGALTGVVLRDTLARIAHGYPEAVRSLVTAVETRDTYTKGHSARVAELSVRIGELMGLRPAALRALAHGGLLHDIGKIGVSDHILNKPDLLTPLERVEIERHPTMGWEIVRQSPSLRGALAVIRHHHEKMDGTGYPDRLVGNEIALEARIAAVADVWDALTSDRAYRPAWPADRALEVMLAGRGNHFDPDPLDALLEMLEADGVLPESRSANPDVRDAAEACHPTRYATVLRASRTSTPDRRK